MPVDQWTRLDGTLSAHETQELPKQYKQAAYIFMGLLVVYSIARGVKGASVLPFWMDEFFTLAIAGQPTVHDLWNLWQRGIDAEPPLFFLIERLTLSLPIQKEVALRLPSILAFPCILICVFAYVRRRSGELIACLCALLFLSTSLFHTYLIDARPYTEVIACIAFAMVCYQRLPSPRWAALFAVSLILAESFHYYAVFAMIPFWFSEAVFFLRTRRFRWPVWLALICGFLPLIPVLSLLLRAKTTVGAHVFARPVFSQVLDYYGKFFAIDRVAGLALLLVSVAAVVWWMARAQRGDLRESGDRDSDSAQGLLLLGLTLLPFITFVLVRIVHGWLLDRYVLATTIGVVVGIGCVLSVIRSNAAVAFLAIFVLSVVGLQERRFWVLSGSDALTENNFSVRSRGELEGLQKFVQKGGHLDLPVVFDREMVYCQIVYYGSAEWTRRLVFLTDEEREIRSEGTDTVVKMNKGLGDFYPLRLEDYAEFTAKHSDFLLFAEPEGWIFQALRNEGAGTQILRASGDGRLYLVKMKEHAQPEN